jgi:hypothetical protein
MIGRGAALLQYQFTLPTLNLMLAATLMRWLMLALIIVGTAWLLKGAFGALGRRHPGGGPRPPESDAATPGASASGDSPAPVGAEG